MWRWIGVAAAAVAACVILAVCVDGLLFMGGYNYERLLHPGRFDDVTAGDVDGPGIAGHKLVICTLCRDNETRMEEGIRRLERIGSCFDDYRVIVFENDSKDRTREWLRTWAVRNDRVHLIDLPGGTTFHTKTGYELEQQSRRKQRMLNMARFRNYYLDALRDVDETFRHVMVVDFDCEGKFDLDGLRHAMSLESQWDVCSCRGEMSFPPFYLTRNTYDSMAFVAATPCPTLQFGDALLRKHLRHLTFYHGSLVRAHGLAPVYSSFNGCALYQRRALRGARYGCVDEVGCEHVGLHHAMHQRGFGRHVVDSKWTVHMGRQGNNNLWSALTS
jgi:hypothetical protein